MSKPIEVLSLNYCDNHVEASGLVFLNTLNRDYDYDLHKDYDLQFLASINKFYNVS